MPFLNRALVVGGLCFTSGAFGQTHDMNMPTSSGHVVFDTSCSRQVQADMDQGLSLLYSFWYDEARQRFSAALQHEPGCAMAYWGEAMSYYQPVETLPAGQQLKEGRRAITAALVATQKTPRVQAYIASLAIIYDDKALPKSNARAQAYSDAMAKLSGGFPSDHVAAVLYALSLLSPELPDDPGHLRSWKAVAVLNGVLREEPDNPGVMHFIIHATDNPQMASQGLDAARRYAQIAPASAHALHMPGHIFARLGLWEDDIRSNLASKAAAESRSSMHTGAENRLHAMEFLQYAYLQVGREDKAAAVAAEAQTIKASELNSGFEAYYGWVEVSFSIRLDLETRNWPAAMAIQAPQGAGPYVLRAVYSGQAVAAGHLRNGPAAEQAMVHYLETYSKTDLAEEEHNLSAQLYETRAWTLFARGDLTAATTLLRPVADHQDKVGKGEVELPAREMLADMLRISVEPQAALAEYRVSLQTDPGRFNTLLHAGETAEKLHLGQEAREYYTLLLKNASTPAPESKKALTQALALMFSH